MNEQDFWHIVAKTNRMAQYQRYRAEELENHLSNLPRERIVEFYIHFNMLVDKAHTGDVYGAGCVLNQHYMSDDGFLYFRYWLISMGRAAYEQALIHPDSMATLDIVHDHDGSPNVYDESYYYAIYDAYKKIVTGEKMFEEPRVQEEKKNWIEPEDFNWQDYTYVTLETKFPLLWNKYLASQLDREAAYKRFSINSEGIIEEW